jgi:cytochrome c
MTEDEAKPYDSPWERPRPALDTPVSRTVGQAARRAASALAMLLGCDQHTAAATSDANVTKLLTKYNCSACHTPDKRLLGPAFRDVARKYADDPSAAEKIQSKIKEGSTGVWGRVPMPPNNLPPAELATITQWIISLK